MANHASLRFRRNIDYDRSMEVTDRDILLREEYARMPFSGPRAPPVPTADRYRDPGFGPPHLGFRGQPPRDMPPDAGLAMFGGDFPPHFQHDRRMRPRVLSRGSQEYAYAVNSFDRPMVNRSGTFPVGGNVPPVLSSHEANFPTAGSMRESYHSAGSGPRSRSASMNAHTMTARQSVQEEDLIARELATAYCHYGRGGSLTPSEIASEDTYDIVDRLNLDEHDPEYETWNIVNAG
ncbi:uncharacterized protein LOC129584653 [Paramacrobiotus metropolitanus]|uniref:uncharacterized protein LOC129584653 n=1 Tax=Paramacrobiotus metropolitanus TaxID=2943436 RepID=UPI002445A0DA|nr:uncharacterized protein LOC129584653 [Paramacrobiotus metropolitanus]XP_055332886.1 uncharacterized protein LOC129584653 [Paramacrobiotus metropolitanus]XP_055332887.1 uncharacterized protein LOC129584653 [Paramacrobiotus metropolitanus]XP_055332888.1 uncharacterized protein LOC129584653 [Paramacrobiotus metropolitanus]XP_055332889.1 uncharacterized protein LOC129584653 [Paramacrobiotus metropolitanus]